MQINIHPTGSSEAVEICVQKEKSLTKIQINMSPTGGQKDTEKSYLESEKDSSAHDVGNGENGHPPLCPLCGIPLVQTTFLQLTVWLCRTHC